METETMDNFKINYFIPSEDKLYEGLESCLNLNKDF